MKARMVVMLTLTGLVLSASLAVGQDASELKPFVGKWRAYVTEGERARRSRLLRAGRLVFDGPLHSATAKR